MEKQNNEANGKESKEQQEYEKIILGADKVLNSATILNMNEDIRSEIHLYVNEKNNEKLSTKKFNWRKSRVEFKN